ncbi:MAG: hypothetical protein ABSA90_12490 [Xanthobacteraceae bacterium]|jgi:hypothetical protein
MSGYHFAAVKAALVAAFGIVEAKQPRFFARLEHLRRIGAMGELRPGKGTKLDYDRDQIDRLLFVVQLSRFSIEPVVTVALIKKHWGPRHRDTDAAVDRGQHSISDLFEAARKQAANPSEHICLSVKIDDFVSTANLPDIGWFWRRNLEGFYYWLGDNQNSASVFDLSAKLQRLDAALATEVDNLVAFSTRSGAETPAAAPPTGLPAKIRRARQAAVPDGTPNKRIGRDGKK